MRDMVGGELDVGRRAEEILQEVPERVIFAIKGKYGGVGAIGVRGRDDSK